MIQLSKYNFKSKIVLDEVNKKLNMISKMMESKKDSNYKIEKMNDSFSQTIFYMEEALLYKRGVHQFQLDEIMMRGESEKIDIEDYNKKLKEVDEILFSEIERSYRNFVTILS